MECTVSDPLPESAPPPVWTVSELNRLVKDILEQSVLPFWLRGELGNLTIHRSGHVYLTLKDARSQISGVFFRGAETAKRLVLCAGMEVEVQGRLSVYEPRGQYQVLIQDIRAGGLGALQRQFEEMRERLRAEGLFDPDRKRPIPELPRCVAVITSPQGAALRDFLRVVGRRFGGLHVRVAPVTVQGKDSARQIAASIGALNEMQACDVIVLTRGGGSLEDLWSFNEEVVARALAESELPVISAVGHERDVTISDLVADLRVATPSAAAELVVRAKAELAEAVQTRVQRLQSAMRLRLANLRRRLERAAGHPILREPRSVVQRYQQRVDELSVRLGNAQTRVVALRQAQLDRAIDRLRALNPKAVLERGYSILFDGDGRAIRDAADASVGTALRGVLARGELDVNVVASRPPDDGAQT
jgi:exodeoxyribonuclease VII large subunit